MTEIFSLPFPFDFLTGAVVPTLKFRPYTTQQLIARSKMINNFFISVDFYFNSKGKILSTGNNSEFGGEIYDDDLSEVTRLNHFINFKRRIYGVGQQ